MIDFYKYHGLGNDYIVIKATRSCPGLTPEAVRIICDRHYGVGSDGILFAQCVGSPSLSEIRLRVYNPDGSEAEKSGNGLRIFAWFLYEHGYVDSLSFPIYICGGIVSAKIIDPLNKIVEIDMGVPNFDARTAAPNIGSSEIVDKECDFGIARCRATFVSVGNPHCIIYGQPVNEDWTRRLGPMIENSPIFPARVNVQFLEVISFSEIRIQVWERGAGYTLASGSSSCAAAAAAYRMGLIGRIVKVHMPGGVLQVSLVENSIQLAGPVEKIFEGKISADLMAKLGTVTLNSVN